MTTGRYLGLDAGNSKTVALVTDADGNVLGRARGGVGDIYATDTAVPTVIATVRAAVDAAAIRIDDLRHAAFRLAGVDWPEDETHWREAIRRQLPELSSYTIKNDGFALLRCVNPAGIGVAITVGTGPAIGARGPAGHEFGGCWWIQRPIGGQELGAAGLRAVIEAEIGTGPRTALSAMLLELYGMHSVAELLHAFTRRERPQPAPDKRAAARSVLTAADQGDGIARAIVADQVGRLAELAVVAADRVGFRADDPVSVTIGGSIVTSGSGCYRTALTEALRARRERFAVTVSSASPVVGAAIDAIAEAGGPIDDAVRQRLVITEHPADFLRT